jgi:hypothetical protein
MVVLRLVGKVADVKLKGRSAIRSDTVDLVVDSLLSALIDKEIIPKAGSNYVAKASIGIYDSVGVFVGFRITLRRAGISPVTIIWQGVVGKLIVEITQTQKLDIIRARLEMHGVGNLHH